MQPIYDLDQSVRDDVAKLRAEKRVKPDTGGRWGGSGIGASPAAGSLQGLLTGSQCRTWFLLDRLLSAAPPWHALSSMPCCLVSGLVLIQHAQAWHASAPNPARLARLRTDSFAARLAARSHLRPGVPH